MDTILIVYHRIDFDGLCSMAVIRKWAEGQGYEVEARGYNYGDPAPERSGGPWLGGIRIRPERYDKIFIVDCCLPAETMKYWSTSTEVVWIDHHCTAIKESVEQGFDDLNGLREEGVGACELCWRHIYPGTPVPLIVQLLATYDVWDKNRLDWEKLTLPFQYGLRARGLSDAEQFYEFYRDAIWAPLNIEWSVVNEGLAILRYARETGRRACKAYGFVVTIGTKRKGKSRRLIKGLALLTGHFGALEMEESVRAMGCDVAVCLNRSNADDGTYKVSIYAGSSASASAVEEFNLGEYLKAYYHGGGHRAAAGGTLTEKEFRRLLTRKEL